MLRAQVPRPAKHGLPSPSATGHARRCVSKLRSIIVLRCDILSRRLKVPADTTLSNSSKLTKQRHVVGTHARHSSARSSYSASSAPHSGGSQVMLLGNGAVV